MRWPALSSRQASAVLMSILSHSTPNSSGAQQFTMLRVPWHTPVHWHTIMIQGTNGHKTDVARHDECHNPGKICPGTCQSSPPKADADITHLS